jgi:hypothetical protein
MEADPGHMCVQRGLRDSAIFPPHFAEHRRHKPKMTDGKTLPLPNSVNSVKKTAAYFFET